MKAIFVGSGSKGNATVFISGDHLIQFDAGITKKRVNVALGPYGKTAGDVHAFFITHNHTDHIGCLDVLTRHGAPIYTGEHTIEKEHQSVEPGEGIEVGPFTVIPFSSHHDAPEPLNFIILVEGMKIGYVTDTGFVDEIALSLLSNCDYYIFESNYEPKLLEESQRPKWLKDRIRGKSGHLSNLDCSRYLKKLVGERTKGIFLAHLSEECNTPSHALDQCEKGLRKAKKTFNDLKVVCLPQWESLEAELLP